jgi:hypothetical protein
MLRFYAENFVQAMITLSGVRWDLTRVDSSLYNDPARQEMLRASLRAFQIWCEDVKLDATAAGVEELLNLIAGPIKPGMSLLLDQRMMDIEKRLQHELAKNVFLRVEYKDLSARKEPLFGPNVEARFPEMSEDIAEAGKCIALERPTAAVFHLMRVMEIAAQKLGDALGVQLVSDKVWQVILDQVNKAIRAMDQKDPKTKVFAAISSHLYNVKLAWRNEVMHPKQTYTSNEAQKVLVNVEIFVRDLATVL